MWIITVYKDYGNHGENFSKQFIEESDAEEFLEMEIKSEFDFEITEGLITDQEVQNMINNRGYIYFDQNKEVSIIMEEDDR